MDEQKDESSKAPSPRKGKRLIIALALVVVCIVAWIFWPKQALLITIYMIALLVIGSFFSVMRRKGIVCPPPVIGFLIPILAILLAILMPAINKTHKIAHRVICSIQMECLGSALMAYIADYDGKLPPADKWCDLIITQGDFVPQGLYCPTSDAVEGESSYAININVAGKNIKEVPPDMILLFETDIKKEDSPRNTPVSKRASYSFLEKNNPEWVAKNKNRLVYSNRWNLSGGPEMMSTPHVLSGQPGCNVVYTDGHPAFISGDGLKFLRWTAEELATQPEDANSPSR